MASHDVDRRAFLQGTAAASLLSFSGSGWAQADSKVSPAPFQLIDSHRITVPNPRQLALKNNRDVCVAGEEGIYEYDSQRHFRQRIATDAPVVALAIDADNQYHVATKSALTTYDADRQQVRQWHLPDDSSQITDLAVCRDRLFVADSGHRVVWAYDLKGNLLRQISKHATFSAPQEFFSLTAAPDGEIYVANPSRHRIEIFSPDGEYLHAWGGKTRTLQGFQGCCNPVSICRLSDELLITAERGPGRIKLFHNDGTFAQLVAGPEIFEEHSLLALADQSLNCAGGAFDLAVDGDSRIHVLDVTASRLHTFERGA